MTAPIADTSWWPATRYVTCQRPTESPKALDYFNSPAFSFICIYKTKLLKLNFLYKFRCKELKLWTKSNLVSL